MRKRISLFLALIMVFSMAVPVFGTTDDSAELEKIIKSVKAVVTVPAELSEFGYSTWYHDDKDKNSKVWDLSWSSSDGKYLSITADNDGTIFNYYKSERNKDSSGLGNISKEDAMKVAQTFMARVLPKNLQDTRLMDSAVNNYAASFRYQVYVNDIPVDFMTISISIDKYTGEVSNYYTDNFFLSQDITFPSTAGAIGEGAAREAFIKTLAPELIYQSYYDWQKKEINIFALYEDISNYQYIDAFTGNVVVAQSGDFGAYYASASGMSSDEAKLTPQEQAAVDKTTGLISQADASNIIKKKVSDVSSSATVGSARLYHDQQYDTYFWSISFEDAYGTVNAKSGELVSFYLYTGFTDKESGISKEAALGIAEKFLKDVSSDKWDQVTLSENRSVFGDDYYQLWYGRQVNGHTYTNDYMSLFITKNGGKIQSYNSSWHENTTFPSIAGVMGESKAFDIFAADKGFGLKYVMTENDKVTLAYGYINNETYFLEPFTGQKLGYDGKAYQKTTERSYSDISGKWYETIVTKLLDNGYYIDSDTFSGNSQITQEGFLRYLYAPEQRWYDGSDEFYEMLEAYDIITESERAPTQLLTRQDAAKFVIRYAGQGLSAKQYQIYKNQFTDSIQEEYMGYAALAKAFGIMNGDAKGRFNGTNILTNAEAAVIIYNTLELK